LTSAPASSTNNFFSACAPMHFVPLMTDIWPFTIVTVVKFYYAISSTRFFVFFCCFAVVKHCCSWWWTGGGCLTPQNSELASLLAGSRGGEILQNVPQIRFSLPLILLVRELFRCLACCAGGGGIHPLMDAFHDVCR
jgi:hypothetical protein